jgi:hypothetical protein
MGPGSRSLLDGAARRKELACPGRQRVDVKQPSRGTKSPSPASVLLPPQSRGRRECRALIATSKAWCCDDRLNPPPAFPAQWFYDLWRALPGVPGLIAPVVLRNVFAKLDLSVGRPGPRAFAVRVGSPSSHASRRVHRIPASRFVTIGRNVPLDEAGWERRKSLFLIFRNMIILRPGLERLKHTGVTREL